MTTNRKHDKWQMLHFQCCQPTKMTMARTFNLAFFLGHPIFSSVHHLSSSVKHLTHNISISTKAGSPLSTALLNLHKNYKYSFCLMVEASDHVYVWPQTYTCHMYSFTYRLYFLPANPCDMYKSAVRHIHDPMLVP